jgi:hypothetical protein
LNKIVVVIFMAFQTTASLYATNGLAIIPKLEAHIVNKTKQPQIYTIFNDQLKGIPNSTFYISPKTPEHRHEKSYIPISVKIAQHFTPDRLTISTPQGIHSFCLRSADPQKIKPIDVYLNHSWYDTQEKKHTKKSKSFAISLINELVAQVTITNKNVHFKISPKPLP